MQQNEVHDLCKAHTGLGYALEKEFGNRIPLKALETKPVGAIDAKLLGTFLSEYRESEGTKHPNEPNLWRYQVESLYIVWSDGRIEKSDQVEYRCVGTVVDDWTGEASSYEMYTGDEDDEIHPVASHFVERADIEYLILLESRCSRLEGSQKKIENITITIFVPDAGTDITATSRGLMEAWESGGQCGLDDYLDSLQ